MYQRKVVLPFLQLEDSLNDTGVLKLVILWPFVLLVFSLNFEVYFIWSERYRSWVQFN